MASGIFFLLKTMPKKNNNNNKREKKKRLNVLREERMIGKNNPAKGEM